MLETISAVCIGIGLSASCGFRVFVPLLIAAVTAKAGWLAPAEGFEWLATWPAIAAFGVATVLEIGGYYFPWLDNLLDTASTPAAVVAGVIATAACVKDMDPLLQWSVAVIAGGGSAGIVKLGLVALRALSSTITGGLANAVVATGEWIGALFLSVLAVVVPIFAAIVSLALVLVLARFAWRLLRRLFRPRTEAATEPRT